MASSEDLHVAIAEVLVALIEEQAPGALHLDASATWRALHLRSRMSSGAASPCPSEPEAAAAGMAPIRASGRRRRRVRRRWAGGRCGRHRGRRRIGVSEKLLNRDRAEPLAGPACWAQCPGQIAGMTLGSRTRQGEGNDGGSCKTSHRMCLSPWRPPLCAQFCDRRSVVNATKCNRGPYGSAREVTLSLMLWRWTCAHTCWSSTTTTKSGTSSPGSWKRTASASPPSAMPGRLAAPGQGRLPTRCARPDAARRKRPRPRALAA